MPGSRSPRTTSSRKKQHVDIAVSGNVDFRHHLTGLERIEFVHNALPEIDYSEIDTSTTFLARKIRLPFMISCMTGGYAGALQINRDLASVCEELQIPLGIGSQRQALENKRFHASFAVVRKVAPRIPIIGNIGAAEVAGISIENARAIVDLVEADALAVHLNPLQELLQPEGNPRFRGVLKGIERLSRELSVPLIVKEIGAGISADVAGRLLDAGVRYIDAAGAGGTSWAGVEIIRRKKADGMDEFWDWGIPLADALRGLAALRAKRDSFTIIASGGIRNGIEAAKCLALGADLTASARIFLSALQKRGKNGLRNLLDDWAMQLRGVMFLTGAATIAELRQTPMVESER